MGRLLPLGGALGTVILLVAGCASQELHFSRKATDPAIYQIIYVEPKSDDPLHLNALIRGRLEEQGYTVLREPTGYPAGEILYLSYDYGTGLDLNEDGTVSHRLKWFRVRLVDNADQSEIASGELISAILDPSPEDDVVALITALGERLRHRQNTVETAGQSMISQPAKQDGPVDSVLQTKKESTSAFSHPRTETKLQEENSPSNEETQPSNPWIPRLKSWGFDDWGKEEKEE